MLSLRDSPGLFIFCFEQFLSEKSIAYIYLNALIQAA
jgi:hypothetical protein|tara:strand:- start:239 stop:349 length:111 start_codon:yes stop_codon:yes gene_type:complete